MIGHRRTLADATGAAPSRDRRIERTTASPARASDVLRGAIPRSRDAAAADGAHGGRHGHRHHLRASASTTRSPCRTDDEPRSSPTPGATTATRSTSPRDADGTRRRLRELLDGAGTVAVISDETVEALYGQRARARRCASAGAEVLAHAVPAGEASKSLDVGRRAVALARRQRPRPPRRRPQLRRRRGRRPRRLGRERLHARRAVRQRADDAARDGRRRARRQGRGQPPGRQEPARRLPAARRRDLRPAAISRSLEPRQLAAGVAECIKKGVIASPEYFALHRARAPTR